MGNLGLYGLNRVYASEVLGDSFDEQFEAVACYICGPVRGTRRILERGHFGLPAHVCICKGCGLVFLNPRWAKTRYQRFYASEYDSLYRPSPRTERRQMLAKQILERVGRREFRAVLGIGAGRGETLDLAIREYGAVALFAIEPSLECQALLPSLGIQVIASDVEAEWKLYCPIQFDLIIMRAVLEHVLDPILALRKVASALAEGGVLYLAVPNMMAPRLPLRTDWFRAVHTYYFSAATLLRTMYMGGLEPLGGLHRGEYELYCVARRSDGHAASEQPSVYLRQLLIIQAYLAMEAAASPLRRMLPRFVKSAVRRFMKGD